MVYLAGPFFTLGQRWLIEEALRTLRGLGCPVFSPLHEVGFGDPQTVAPADLAGLDGSTAVLALLDGSDPGTLFEVGHARSRGIPVVGLAEDVLGRDLTMPLGSGCDIVSDLTTAAYRTAWASMR
jgi:nucleoside 2-deoxyribosyltransferase